MNKEKFISVGPLGPVGPPPVGPPPVGPPPVGPVGPCACVFDIDGTLTCHPEGAKEAVRACKEHSCKIFLNTARTINYYDDIPFKQIGLERTDIIRNFYSDWDILSMNANNMNNYIADKKVQHLQTVVDEFGIPKNRLIFFDDNFLNVDTAAKAGFHTILAKNGHLEGLPTSVGKQINDYFNNL